MRVAIAIVLGILMLTQANNAMAGAKNLGDYDLLVSSASYATGNAKNGVFRVNPVSGELLGKFGCGAEITDPRGIRLNPRGDHVVVTSGDDKLLVFNADSGSYFGQLPLIEGLNPGGVKFGRDGRFYVGARTAKSIVAYDVVGGKPPSTFVPGTFVKFPRGLAASPDGFMYLASGTNPATGDGQNTVLRFKEDGSLDESFKVADDELSPTDTEVAPNGNLLSHSEFPFKDPNAVTTVREYDRKDGHLVRVFDAGVDAKGERVVHRPRGITIGPDGMLYASGQDNIVRFSLETGKLDKVVFASPGINAQSIIFVPHIEKACAQRS